MALALPETASLGSPTFQFLRFGMGDDEIDGDDEQCGQSHIEVG